MAQDTPDLPALALPPNAEVEVSLSMTERPLSLLLIGAIVALAWVPGTMQRAEDAPDVQVQTAEATPWVATTTLSAVPTPDGAATPRPLYSASSVSALLTRYLEQEASAPDRRAAWDGHIREVVVGLHTASVRTDLGGSPDDRLLAEEIAGAVARFASSPFGRGITVPDIEVLGANRQPLASQSATGLARKVSRP